MRKIVSQIVLIILFASFNNYSQSHTISLTEYGYYKTITYFPTKSNPNSTVIAFHNNNTFVGTHFFQEPNEHPPYERDMIERTKAGTYLGTSNLNLAPNEIIDVAKLVVTTSSTSGSGNFNVKFIGNSTSGSNAEEFWYECNSGSYLGSRPYSSGGSITVTNIVKNNIGNQVWFGFYEVGNGSAKLTVELQIWTSFDPQVDITAQNNFTGGSIKVGVNTSATSRTSPFPFTAYPGNTINLEAVEQSNGGYSRVWNDTEAPSNKSNWDRNGFHRSYIRAYSFAASENDDNKTYTANLRKRCEIKFINKHAGGESGGQIKVDNVPHNSPTSNFDVIEQNAITGYAIDHTLTGIHYTFSKWTPGNSTSRNKTFYPSLNQNYEANFIGVPLNSHGSYSRDLHFNNTDPVGTPIEVMWNQHPNSSVSKYEIYRKTKYGSSTLISTVNRTGSSNYSYTYTDYDYSITNNKGSNNLLKYDVRSYYSPDQTLSDYAWGAIYGEHFWKKTEENKEENATLKVLEYTISNYPNPFNPTTTIHYQLPEDANVSIKVFDILGKQIAELVNGVKGIGKHNVSFDSSNLSAGLYFYIIEAKPTNLNGKGFSKTNKMLLVK